MNLHDVACPTCFGIGVLEVHEGTRVHDRTCPDCHGSGWEPDDTDEREACE